VALAKMKARARPDKRRKKPFVGLFSFLPSAPWPSREVGGRFLGHGERKGEQARGRGRRRRLSASEAGGGKGGEGQQGDDRPFCRHYREREESVLPPILARYDSYVGRKGENSRSDNERSVLITADVRGGKPRTGPYVTRRDVCGQRRGT